LPFSNGHVDPKSPRRRNDEVQNRVVREGSQAETIRITAALRMERPVAAVRAQYRDIDHHIRNDVHPSIRYQWEPSEPGERKIRTTFRILGVPQYDVSLLEDGEDGSVVIRYVEGSNAGMVLVHRFVPLGENATHVELVADAPSTVGRKLLGPLFVAGARQVMKKALAEDKRDLEKGEFTPSIAAGNLGAAFEPSLPLAPRDPATKRLALEAACLVAAADGVLDAAERDALHRLARFLRADTETAWMMTRVAHYEKIAVTAGIAAEAERLGVWIRANDIATPSLVAAAVVALVSQGMSLGELALLRRLATASGFDEEGLGPIVDAADDALSLPE
jgi:hypothetical protein